MQKKQFLAWAPKVFIIGLVLGLMCLVPAVWFPFQLTKVLLVTVGMLVAALFFVYGGGMRTVHGLQGPLMFVVLSLPLTYALSWLFSVDTAIGFSGYAVESDTVLFMLICSLALVFSSWLFQGVRTGRLLLLSVMASLSLVGVFQYLVIFFGQKLLPFQAFSDRSTNLVGKWNDLGIGMGLLLFLCVLWIEFGGETKTSRRVGSFCAVAALFLLLAIIQFPLVWMLLFSIFLGVCAWHLFVSRNVAWVALASAALSLGFVFYGATLNANLTKILPVSSLEVRPSSSSTIAIAKDAHQSSPGRFLVGSGPQTFGEMWLLHKPASVNQSAFWNLDFAVGYSTLLTAFETVGALGVLAWLAPIILLLLAVGRLVWLKRHSKEEQFVFLGLSLSAIYLWLCLSFYVPSQDLLLLAFTLCGAALGLVFNKHATESGVAGTESHASLTVGKILSVAFVKNAVRSYAGVTLGALLVLVLVGSTFVVARRTLSEIYVNQGAANLGQNNVDSAMLFAARAYGTEKTADALRLSFAAGAAKINLMLSTTSAPTAQTQAQFNVQLLQTVAFGRQLLMPVPKDYRAYLVVAQFYDLLTSFRVPNAYESAQQMYQEVVRLNPNNPQAWLLLAQLSVKHGDEKATLANISKALTLKNDYTDAIMFMVQFYIAKKDLPNAIAAALAAAQSAPNSPVMLFELGLLYYSTNDTANAIPPLERAVAIESDYANAKYFLGLSYAAQRRAPEALQQFQDLVQSNPDNAEVAAIQKNLQEGRKPFQEAGSTTVPVIQNKTTIE
ncbi:MAG: tetratricopeptide repeat protein [bacterium]